MRKIPTVKKPKKKAENINAPSNPNPATIIHTIRDNFTMLPHLLILIEESSTIVKLLILKDFLNTFFLLIPQVNKTTMLMIEKDNNYP
jgi:hypothetical protein